MLCADFRLPRYPNTISPDEIVTIVCYNDPSEPDQREYIKFNCSSLLQSPTLAQVIHSDSYLRGGQMIFEFREDPPACFKIVKRYFRDGPYCFTASILKNYLRRRFTGISLFMVLVRLHLLATKLALLGLMGITYACLQEAGALTKPDHCLDMASLIFRTKSDFAAVIQDWCMRQIREHFVPLYFRREWNELIPRLNDGFQARWSELVGADRTILAAIEEEDENEAIEEQVDQVEQSHQTSVVPGIVNPPRRTSNDDILDQVLNESMADPVNEDQRDVELQTPKDGNVVDGAKVKYIKIKTSRKGRPWSRIRLPAPQTESAKARQIIGVDAGKKSWANYKSTE